MKSEAMKTRICCSDIDPHKTPKQMSFKQLYAVLRYTVVIAGAVSEMETRAAAHRESCHGLSD